MRALLAALTAAVAVLVPVGSAGAVELGHYDYAKPNKGEVHFDVVSGPFVTNVKFKAYHALCTDGKLRNRSGSLVGKYAVKNGKFSRVPRFNDPVPLFRGEADDLFIDGVLKIRWVVKKGVLTVAKCHRGFTFHATTP